MIFLQLFIVFFQIGIFGFGGGYSMISLIQGQVVTQYHWMTMQEFTDVVAISQMTPGPIGINSATYCGYTAVHNAGMGGMMAILGSAVAAFDFCQCFLHSFLHKVRFNYYRLIYRFCPSWNVIEYSTTMASADFSRQALLHDFRKSN